MNVGTRTDEHRHLLYQRGKTDGEIGVAVGATRRAITKWRASRNLPPNTPGTPPSSTPTGQDTMSDAWLPLAACLGMNTALWYPEKGEANAYMVARQVCASCPVQAICLDDALAHETRDGGRYGMRGALTPDERKTLARTRERARSRTNAKARVPATTWESVVTEALEKAKS